VHRSAPLLALLCAGCSGWQSVLQPGGPQAHTLTLLLWWFIGVCAVVWLSVMLVLLASLWRTKPAKPQSERSATVIVVAAVAATVLVITGLTFMSYAATRAMSVADGDPLVIKLSASQWWWQAIYDNPQPDRSFITANELHVPVGRAVRVELTATDVIHSLWIPNLAGKQDLIPGRSNALTFVVQLPGVYRGQCAEFCGVQHAHMALLIVAEDSASFEAWREAQRRAADPPADEESRSGRDFFVGRQCGACHTVRGTAAAGTLGPDLTHVASRGTIAAGLLPTTRGSLAAWIADPQTIKPGNNMPLVPMTPAELRAVSAWLAGLR
jgi:cytochrome c oxidase subunit II